MGTWIVRVEAVISDEMEVEADTEEEAIENAHDDWSFVEASQWTETVLKRPEEDDE
jgi:hypothetical protein